MPIIYLDTRTISLVMVMVAATLSFVMLFIGVSVLLQDDLKIEDVLKRADSALYKVKQNGRNQVLSA